MSLDNPNPIINAKKNSNYTFTSDSYSGDGMSPSEIYEFIRDIKDPEHEYTLEQLSVVSEEQVIVEDDGKDTLNIRIEFTPTVPHCSLAAMIGLCLREKISREIFRPYKLDIFIKPGSHSTEQEINKQINDKERVAAALENPNMKVLVEQYINYVRSDY